jgi:hypothetical protein
MPAFGSLQELLRKILGDAQAAPQHNIDVRLRNRIAQGWSSVWSSVHLWKVDPDLNRSDGDDDEQGYDEIMQDDDEGDRFRCSCSDVDCSGQVSSPSRSSPFLIVARTCTSSSRSRFRSYPSSRRSNFASSLAFKTGSKTPTQEAPCRNRTPMAVQPPLLGTGKEN